MQVPKGGDSRTAALPAWLEARSEGVIIALHVQPGARRTAIVGLHGARLKVAVRSPPADGRANASLIEFLAARLAVPKARVKLLSGTTSREKRVAVETAEPAANIVLALAPDDGQ